MSLKKSVKSIFKKKINIKLSKAEMNRDIAKHFYLLIFGKEILHLDKCLKG